MPFGRSAMKQFVHPSLRREFTVAMGMYLAD